MANTSDANTSPSDWIPLVVVFGLVLILVMVVAYMIMDRSCDECGYVQVIGAAQGISPAPKMQGEVNGKIAAPPPPGDQVLVATVHQDRNNDGQYTSNTDDPVVGRSPFIAGDEYVVPFIGLNSAPPTFFIRLEGPGATYEDKFTCAANSNVCLKTVNF